MSRNFTIWLKFVNLTSLVDLQKHPLCNVFKCNHFLAIVKRVFDLENKWKWHQWFSYYLFTALSLLSICQRMTKNILLNTLVMKQFKNLWFFKVHLERAIMILLKIGGKFILSKWHSRTMFTFFLSLFVVDIWLDGHTYTLYYSVLHITPFNSVVTL